MHLYLHVPFCARRCSYCDFAIAVRRETPNVEYAELIITEWSRRFGDFVNSREDQLDTIYFGGGTPSRLDPDTVAHMIERVVADVPLATDAEVTLETNPDDVTEGRAAGWRQAGVNRISLGVQSHNPDVLEWMHRTHTADQVAPAMATLREAGFDNISVDLIFALPREVPRDWSRDLEQTLKLEPDHLSLYGLTVEPHTPLAKWTERGTTHPARDDRYEAEFLEANRSLTKAGFRHYEVSNAARAGRESRHNSMYWNGADYLGLGPSAHSFVGGERIWNEREWAAWSRRIAADGTAIAGREQLDESQRRLEQLYLGLRTDTGLPDHLVSSEDANLWTLEGWARHSKGRIHLTPMGWLRLDALVTRLAAS